MESPGEGGRPGTWSARERRGGPPNPQRRAAVSFWRRVLTAVGDEPLQARVHLVLLETGVSSLPPPLVNHAQEVSDPGEGEHDVIPVPLRRELFEQEPAALL